MEILSYLHLNGRRLLSVVVVAVIAAGVTALLLSDSSETYEAEAVVFAGRAMPTDSTAIDLGPFVSDLETVLALGPTRQQVAEATGVPDEDILLTTSLSADRSNLSVVAEQTSPEEAENVATEAARAGLRTLLEQEVARAQRELEAAETQLLDARAELETFRGDNATYNPSDEYDIVFETLKSLQLRLLDPTLTDADREDLSQREPGLDAELDRLSLLQQPYIDLVQAVAAAEISFNQATRQIRTTEAALAGAESGDFVIVTPAEQASSRNTLVSGIVATVIVVGLLSVALFAVVDARTRQGQDERTVDVKSDEAIIDQTSIDDREDRLTDGPSGETGSLLEHSHVGENEQVVTFPDLPEASSDDNDLETVEEHEPVDVDTTEPDLDEDLEAEDEYEPDDVDTTEPDLDEDLEADDEYEPDDVDTTEPDLDDALDDLLNELLRHRPPDPNDTDGTDRGDDGDGTDGDEDGEGVDDTDGAASETSIDDESEGADRSSGNI